MSQPPEDSGSLTGPPIDRRCACWSGTFVGFLVAETAFDPDSYEPDCFMDSRCWAIPGLGDSGPTRQSVVHDW